MGDMGRRDRDRMTVRFITVYSISAYHQLESVNWNIFPVMVLKTTFNNISVIS
jgi:hypothetical protein